MTLLLEVIYSSLEIGGLGCFVLVSISVIISMLLKLGWLLNRSVRPQLNASLMVPTSPLRLLVASTWVKFLAFHTSLEILHRITYVSQWDHDLILQQCDTPPVYPPLFVYVKVKNIVITRSVYTKWKRSILHILCSPLLEGLGKAATVISKPCLPT